MGAVMSEVERGRIFITASDESHAALSELTSIPIHTYLDDDPTLLTVMAAHSDVYIIPNATQVSQSRFAKIASAIVNAGHSCHVMDVSGLKSGWSIASAQLTPEQFATLPFKKFAPNVVQLTPKRVKGPKLGSASDTTRELWREYKLEMSHSNVPFENIDNALRALTAAQVPIWYDEFLQRAMNGDREFRDSDYVDLTVWMQRDLELRKMSLRNVTAATDAYIRANVRNCAQEWLQSLVWDGTARLDSMAVDGFGTVDDAYHRAVLRCFMLGMVKRVLEPGCQVDTMPVFESPEGMRKSSALRIIGGDWFAECHEEITGKDFLQIMPGKMLLEVSELYSFRKADVERIKGIITNRVDRYRASYGRIAQDHPRMCVFAGTTNRDDYNASDTGARRLLPVVCGIIDLDWLRANREQLFAEAVHRVRAGESHWDVPIADAKAMVEARRSGDVWETAILSWCKARPQVEIDDVLANCLGVDLARATNVDGARVRSVLRAAGWNNCVTKIHGHSVRVWRPPAQNYASERLEAIKAEQQPLAPTPPISDPAPFEPDCPF